MHILSEAKYRKEVAYYFLDFFPTHSHLVKNPTFISFSIRRQKSNFVSMHKGQL